MNQSLNGRNHHNKGLEATLEKGVPASLKPLIEEITAEVKSNLHKAQVVGEQVYDKGEKVLRTSHKTVRRYPMISALAALAIVGLVARQILRSYQNQSRD